MPLPKPLNPELDQRTFVVDDDWWLADPDALEYEVFEYTDEQTVTSVSARAAVDLVNDRISIGHYRVDVSALGLSAGTFFLRWYSTDADLEGGSEVTWDGPPFDVLTDGEEVVRALPGPMYALVSDLRREGVPATTTDARCLRALHVASRYVEAFTGRRFIAEAKELHLDGFGANRALLLEEPVIALSRVAVQVAGFEPDESDLGRTLLRVYNRHLRQLLTSPDDRESPKIELVYDTTGLRPHVPLADRSRGIRWPLGRQDLVVAGAFGYTDPDGSPMGRTPELIRHCTIMLALRELAQLNDGTGRAASGGGTIKREKTRDQEVEWAVSTTAGTATTGAFTGTAEIDTLLARYRRPPRIGAA